MADISQPTHELRILYDLKCPMRDGVEVSSDVYMPADEGPHPALILRTPYDNISATDLKRIGHLYFAKRGYALVTQDARRIRAG